MAMCSQVQYTLNRLLDINSSSWRFDTRNFSTEELRQLQLELPILGVAVAKAGVNVERELEKLCCENNVHIYDSLLSVYGLWSCTMESRINQILRRVNRALAHRDESGYAPDERENHYIISGYHR